MTAKGVWVLTTNIMRVRYILNMFMKMYYYISAVNCAAYLFFFLSGLIVSLHELRDDPTVGPRLLA